MKVAPNPAEMQDLVRGLLGDLLVLTPFYRELHDLAYPGPGAVPSDATKITGGSPADAPSSATAEMQRALRSAAEHVRVARRHIRKGVDRLQSGDQAVPVGLTAKGQWTEEAAEEAERRARAGAFRKEVRASSG